MPGPTAAAPELGAPVIAADATRHRVRSVEGIRAVAAVLVFAYHIRGALEFAHPGLFGPTATRWIGRFGPLGVGIFFALSGYLLYLPFARSALARTAAPRLGGYYLRRYTRVLPAYWVALAVYLFVIGPNQIHTVTDGFVYFGLLQNYRTGSLLSGLGVAWTLVIEVGFYTVLPALAWALRGSARAPAAALRRQLIGLAVLFAVGPLVRVWALWFRSRGQAHLGSWQPHVLPELWLPGYLDWFVFGMLFAVAVAWWNLVGEVRGPLRRLADHPGLCWLGAGVLYAVQLLARSPSSQFSRGNPVSEMTVNTVMPLIAALVVAPVVLAPTGGGWIRTALGSRPIASIGTVSYGIYLWHTVVILQVYYWITDGSLPRSATILAVLVVALTAVAAVVSYVVVESPMMRWSARVSRSRLPGSPPSTTAVGVSA